MASKTTGTKKNAKQSTAKKRQPAKKTSTKSAKSAALSEFFEKSFTTNMSVDAHATDGSSSFNAGISITE